jgi:hypothetical protein
MDGQDWAAMGHVPKHKSQWSAINHEPLPIRHEPSAMNPHPSAILRLAIAGCGNWSTAMHLPALKRLTAQGRLTCVGVCDRDQAKAAAYAQQLGAPPVFADLGRMLLTVRPDAAGLAVPCELSAEFCAQAAAARVPFLVEKPPAPSGNAHRRLIDTVGALPHVVAYNRRHAPYIVQAMAWLRGRVIQSVTVLFSRHKRREADFTATAVHAIDTGLFLAGGELHELDLAVTPANGIYNYFINGSMQSGAHLDIQITPDTASAVEHYILRAADRTVYVAFPQPGVMDAPGYVELHEKNRVTERKGPADFGLAADDLPGLGGIVGEYEALLQVLEGRPVVSTLRNTLATQIVREELGRMLTGGKTHHSLKIES